MKRIVIKPEEDTDVSEFIKSVGFVSINIVSVSRECDKIYVEIDENGNEEEIEKMLYEVMRKFKNVSITSAPLFVNDVEVRKYYNLQDSEENIIFWGNGQIGFNEKGKFLLEYFDSLFSNIAYRLHACEKLYPVLLPVSEYSMTGYIKKSPQYAIFCSSVNENLSDLEKTDAAIQEKDIKNLIKEPEFALSPSACFHTYIEYANKTLKNNMLVTFRQNVFRNEGRLNYSEIGRLCDYHVREIVMIGSNEYVVKLRDEIMKESERILKKCGIRGDITQATDSFIVPKMQMYRKIQRVDKSKYEMHLNMDYNQTISVASYNLHGKTFTDTFNIKVENCADTVTACVGFGLQRWVLAFFAQFGFEESNWPEDIRNEYVARNKLKD